MKGFTARHAKPHRRLGCQDGGIRAFALRSLERSSSNSRDRFLRRHRGWFAYQGMPRTVTNCASISTIADLIFQCIYSCRKARYVAFMQAMLCCHIFSCSPPSSTFRPLHARKTPFVDLYNCFVAVGQTHLSRPRRALLRTAHAHTPNSPANISCIFTGVRCDARITQVQQRVQHSPFKSFVLSTPA